MFNLSDLTDRLGELIGSGMAETPLGNLGEIIASATIEALQGHPIGGEAPGRAGAPEQLITAITEAAGRLEPDRLRCERPREHRERESDSATESGSISGCGPTAAADPSPSACL
ncbi:MAG: hypothetical protein R3D33_17830 [Hyphomicrobiaceae bacterium]